MDRSCPLSLRYNKDVYKWVQCVKEVNLLKLVNLEKIELRVKILSVPSEPSEPKKTHICGSILIAMIKSDSCDNASER